MEEMACSKAPANKSSPRSPDLSNLWTWPCLGFLWPWHHYLLIYQTSFYWCFILDSSLSQPSPPTLQVLPATSQISIRPNHFSPQSPPYTGSSSTSHWSPCPRVFPSASRGWSNQVTLLLELSHEFVFLRGQVWNPQPDPWGPRWFLFFPVPQTQHLLPDSEPLYMFHPLLVP